ncbi:sulfite exporter TauE/SafE family protein [Metabacillus sp. 84]|uniref:sulfite exporter TauE/SafE family protein n=1 Tax=Metabacillus sp. 84 TaxID=3404705 RepID=UPI003CEEAB6D
MDIFFITAIFLLGGIGSFMSGLLGIGGSIITYPLLLFVPAAVGAAHFTAHEVSGITSVQVLFASIGGVWVYRKSSFLNKQLIIWMGISVLLGSTAGGLVSAGMPETVINFIYGILALLAVVMMVVPGSRQNEQPLEGVIFNRWLAAVISFVIGAAAGIVGAGGAFLLVPVMLAVLKIPAKMTIASSLAITLIASIGSAAGKIFTDQVEWGPASIVIAASLLASPLGAMAGKKANPKVLKVILSLLILASALKIWADIFIQS